MRKIAFNDGWTCRHAGDSGKGKPVTIPHDAMLDEKRTQESLGGINIGWFEGFDYVYEKEFSVPQEYEDFRLVFEFEGVYRNAEVYLNGKRAGFRTYGYTNFYVEENEINKYEKKIRYRSLPTMQISQTADGIREQESTGRYRYMCCQRSI